MSHRPDLVVVGAGPAALALAWRAADQGMTVVAVAPDPGQPWTSQFGSWAADVAANEARAAIEAVYHAPRVELGRRRLSLDCAYVRLSTPRLQDALRGRCEEAGVLWARGAVAGVDHDARGATVRLVDGRHLRCRVVVDASGAASRLVARADQRAPAFQAAYGILAEVDGHPYASGEMALMDFRGAATPDPSFLYALPLAPDRVFLEETSLVRRPAMSLPALETRLDERLAGLSIRVRRVIATEHCLIPMGTALPLRNQPTIAFGAAAGLIHPASGYSLGRALRFAPAVAEAIAGGLDHDPREAARQAYHALWPDAALRAWELYTFGMEVLAVLDRDEVARFLEAFFALPSATWHGYLRGTLTPLEIVRAMAGVFTRADLSQKARLLRAAWSSSLLRAAFPDNQPAGATLPPATRTAS